MAHKTTKMNSTFIAGKHAAGLQYMITPRDITHGHDEQRPPQESCHGHINVERTEKQDHGVPGE